MYNNYVPIDDLGYKSDIIFDKLNSEKCYKEFLDFIKNCYDENYSFILKYIEINNLEMSSGERAFHNFFSWLNLMPEFNKIINTLPATLHTTLLILIDEIDLYLHPEWQRIIIFNLIQEIKRQFSTYKVQIIFSTHSPLILSDIPRESTIYLNQKEGRSVPDNIDCHRQTFGADLYNLLNDAFYLDRGSIGEFALFKINTIINKLKSINEKKLSLREIEILNAEILGIGNELIRKKLLEMLDKYTEEIGKKEKILILKKRKEAIDIEIQRLMLGEENDTFTI